MYAIESYELTKRYGSLTAVDALSLTIKKGEIFGFVGHNGSGKTTTIMMLCGLLQPTSGNAKVAGFDINKEIIEVKKRIGFLPENTSYYENLTASQNLEFFGELAGLSKSQRQERSKGLLKQVGLEKWADTKVGKFSKGMQQRLGVAQAVMRDPEVVFLDEPTSGLDPQGTKDVRKMIMELGKKGKTVFLSSHMLAEVKQLCDRIGIIRQGKLIASDKIDYLAKKLSSSRCIGIELEVSASKNILVELSKIGGVENISQLNGKIFIRAQKDIREEIFVKVSKSGSKILTLKLVEPTLEDIFMKVYEGNFIWQ